MAQVDPRRAKIHRSYTLAEAARLFDVHRNTVRLWIKAGLPVLRAGRLILILGRDLGPFLAERQSRLKRRCGPGELFCFRCREPRRPREGTLRLVCTDGPTANAIALCRVCGVQMHRRVSLGDPAGAGFGGATRIAG